MITPFGPANDELDRLNSGLDAQVTGKRGPETDPASETDMLAATAHYLARQPETPGETPSTDTLDAIWRNIMDAHAIPAQPETGDTLTRRQDDIGRVQPVGTPEPATFSSWVSLAAVAALLIVIIGSAWSLRQGGGGDEPQIRLAATALDETPETQENEWLTWVTPEECTVEPMSTEEYAEIMREEPDISGRSYEVVGPPDPRTAEAVASAARAHEACKVYGTVSQQRIFETPAYMFFRTFTENRTISAPEMDRRDYEHGMLLSETMPAKEPGAYAEILEETPPDDLIGYMRRQHDPTMPTVFLSLTYDPANAATLADGRVAIPATILYWSGGDPDEWFQVEQWQIDDSTSLYTYIVILDEEDGAWKVDEQLGFCPFTGCDEVWARMAPGAIVTPVATPDPVATPED